ncbi:hypothetical protein B296_00040098 [Ensete ventricosum]|uniref:Uncharacterized protein n=1 Tax=Ensete ventricosum TaxID=4639 RepID=A0A426YLJ3_ENSVE|nr:hypothetical protein B296_00040098 [Ensete ventricosum]
MEDRIRYSPNSDWVDLRAQQNSSKDNGPRLSLGIRPGLDDVVGPRREFARRFTEEIKKLVGSTPGDHRKNTG